MRLLDSHDEQEVSIFSDLLQDQEEQREVHHLLVLIDRVELFTKCVLHEIWVLIILEVVEETRLGLVMVSLVEVV